LRGQAASKTTPRTFEEFGFRCDALFVDGRGCLTTELSQCAFYVLRHGQAAKRNSMWVPEFSFGRPRRIRRHAYVRSPAPTTFGSSLLPSSLRMVCFSLDRFYGVTSPAVLMDAGWERNRMIRARAVGGWGRTNQGSRREAYSSSDEGRQRNNMIRSGMIDPCTITESLVGNTSWCALGAIHTFFRMEQVCG
jgi:hypothetical protein